MRAWVRRTAFGGMVVGGALGTGVAAHWGAPVTQTYPTWNIDFNSSAYPIERGACLTIKVGAGAAAQCGDLRVTHELPAVTIYNSRLAPTLVYNSEHAHPYISTPIDIGMVSGTTRPDSVEVQIWVGSAPTNKTLRATRRWGGAEWPAGTNATRRVTVTYDAINDTTGLYFYELRVANIYPGNIRQENPNVTGGSRNVVNRKASPFGAGWWLAGMDEIKKTYTSPGGPQQYLWVGGDGSTRVFMPPAQLLYDRLDSLVWNAGQQTWTRWLPEGRRVLFNSAGKHTKTINRFGRETQYAYDGNGRLTTITLPSPTALSYTLHYSAAGRLDSIVAPPLGATRRVARLTNPSGLLLSVRNPGDSLVNFGYVANPSNILTSRTDRRGIPTTFAYDSALKVRSSTVQPGSGAAAIVLTIYAGESRGLAKSGTPSSVDTLQNATKIDGPRAGAADTTVVYQERYGSPRRVVDAVGNTTKMQRAYLNFSFGYDEGWVLWKFDRPVGTPAAPLTHVQRYRYEYPRGNLVATRDSGSSAGTLVDSTTYEWDQAFDQLKKVTPMMGNTTTYGINVSNGRREWEEDARGATSRVTYHYDEATFPEQPSRAVVPAAGTNGAATTTYTYTATTRNSATELTPRGLTTTYTRDVLGRVIAVRSPIDSSTTSTRYVERRVGYSLRDDVVAESTLTVNVTPFEATYVRNYANPEGSLDSLVRTFVPDSANIGAIALRWRYDNVGRQVAAIAPDMRVDSTEYNEVGLPVKLVSRRAGPGVQPVTIIYDILNRDSIRTIPAVTYPTRNQGIPQRHFVYGLNAAYVGYSIPQVIDTILYTRDGQVASANNRWARVTRTYTDRGRIASEAQSIAAVDGSFGAHSFAIAHRYDRNGRREKIAIPSQFAAPGQDTIRYSFTTFGPLYSATDPLGNVVQYEYNARSELSRTIYGASGVEQYFTYDQDGRLRTDSVSNSGTTFPRWAQTSLRRARFQLDGGDRVLREDNLAWYADTLRASYTGLGRMRTSITRQTGKLVSLPGSSASFYHASGDSLVLDGLGNVTGGFSGDTILIGGQTPPPQDALPRAATYASGVGRILSEGASIPGIRAFVYDTAGNETFRTLTGYAPTYQRSEDRASFYDASSRLVAEEWRTVREQNPDLGYRTSLEEYRHDALGRRVWARAQRGCDFVPPEYPELVGESIHCRLSYVRRTVWDGNQELAEVQSPGGSTQSAWWELDAGYNPALPLDADTQKDPNPHYGQVVYTTGLALDQPVSIVRLGYTDRPTAGGYTQWPTFAIMPLWDRMGTARLGVFSDGAAVRQLTAGGGACASSGANRCVKMYWQASLSPYDLTKGWTPQSYMGSLLEQKRNSSGTYYRRNRAYDPQTGRFTQEDPIGLAGGLNLYGYANGDPVNFSDPFGLCPPLPLCRLAAWWLSRGGPGVAAIGAASTGLSSRLAPGGGLLAHEARGGHTIERHVGQSIIDLSSRLKAQPNISAASSFGSRAAAESGVASAMEQKSGEIAAWLGTTSDRFVFSASLKEGLGYVLERGAQLTKSASGVRIVLDRAPGTELGYLIRTAYPTPQ